MTGIVVVTCDACGCSSAKAVVQNPKPTPCQFCGVTRPPWWQAAYDAAPWQKRGMQRKAKRMLDKLKREKHA